MNQNLLVFKMKPELIVLRVCEERHCMIKDILCSKIVLNVENLGFLFGKKTFGQWRHFDRLGHH